MVQLLVVVVWMVRHAPVWSRKWPRFFRCEWKSITVRSTIQSRRCFYLNFSSLLFLAFRQSPLFSLSLSDSCSIVEQQQQQQHHAQLGCGYWHCKHSDFVQKRAKLSNLHLSHSSFIHHLDQLVWWSVINRTLPIVSCRLVSDNKHGPNMFGLASLVCSHSTSRVISISNSTRFKWTKSTR